MKLKISIAVCLIFLIGCKTKEIKTINKIQTDSSSHIEVKKEIEILTFKTDTGLIIEEEIIDYQILTDSAGIKTSMPIKKFKKKWHKYNREIKAEEKQQIRSDQKDVIKKTIKSERVEKTALQFKWFIIIFFICLLLIGMLFRFK